MTAQFHTLIRAEDLAALIADNAALRIFDCRARLGNPHQGAELFAQGHIPGAQHADLDRHLSASPNQQGRHPLPDPETWLQQVRQWGVRAGDQVVLYDDVGGQMAARAWWMMRWLGHSAAAVLDGGMAQWTGPLESGSGRAPEPERVSVPSDFQPGPSLTRLWSVDQVLANLHSQDHLLVDARAEARFHGEEEPIDPVAGHIPNAQCLPSSGNLEQNGLFKTPEALRQRFAHVDPATTVCYCGSGVTATHNILAMNVAGLAEPGLYADSWSGWITDSTRPIAR